MMHLASKSTRRHCPFTFIFTNVVLHERLCRANDLPVDHTNTMNHRGVRERGHVHLLGARGPRGAGRGPLYLWLSLALFYLTFGTSSRKSTYHSSRVLCLIARPSLGREPASQFAPRSTIYPIMRLHWGKCVCPQRQPRGMHEPDVTLQCCNPSSASPGVGSLTRSTYRATLRLRGGKRTGMYPARDSKRLTSAREERSSTPNLAHSLAKRRKGGPSAAAAAMSRTEAAVEIDSSDAAVVTCTQTYTHANKTMYKCMYIYMYIHVHPYAYMCAGVYACVHIYIYVYKYTYMYTCTYINIYINIYTYIYIYSRRSGRKYMSPVGRGGLLYI